MSERTTRIGVFGGSFNPPHLAHVTAVALALSLGEIDEVLVVPTFVHPFAKALAPYDDRVAMCELAFGIIHHVSVSRVEEALGGESRTLRTLEHLQVTHPHATFRFIMGADLVAEAPKWHAFDRIRAIAPPLVLGRAGVALTPAQLSAAGVVHVTRNLLPELSSTDARKASGAGDRTQLEESLPSAVLAYIDAHGLYA